MSGHPPDQREFWDRRADAWARRAESIDAMSDVYGVPVMEALELRPGERVLDVGCGPGSTTVTMATRVAPGGEVLGVDISPAMIAVATRRASELGASNVGFVVADAEKDGLGSGFDAAFSRFGVMFFTDPVAAFTNIASALRPGGRLACAVWAALGDNPWMFVPTLAAAAVLDSELALPGPDQPGPFSLSDVEHTTEVLGAAGFTDIAVERIEGARLITAGAAGDNVTSLLEVGPLGDAYEAADERARGRAVEAVLEAIEPYRQGDGWLLPGAARKVVARRP